MKTLESAVYSRIFGIECEFLRGSTTLGVLTVVCSPTNLEDAKFPQEIQGSFSQGI